VFGVSLCRVRLDGIILVGEVWPGRRRGMMPAVIERLCEAINQHDPDAMVECFDPDYRSEQPAHPNRGFGGKEQVHENWSGMFESFPDIEVEVLRQSTEGDVVWSEWHWSATDLQMAGVTVMGIREDRLGAPLHGARRTGRPKHRRSHEDHNGKGPQGRRVIQALRSGRPDNVFGQLTCSNRASRRLR
jgi:predicted SnoaL-like aldol condensation-catalyzing enzyme